MVKRERRKAEMVKVEEWLAALSPMIDIHNLEVNSRNQLINLHLSIWIEPELQVRMTGTSAAYMPRPVAYNGWKRIVSHQLKETLRKVTPELLPIPGHIRATMRFYVSNRHRWAMGDLNNYVKATEDMLNQCGHLYDEKALERWPEMNSPFQVWIDDRKVRRNGEGQGVYWTDRNPRIEILLEAVQLLGPTTKGKQ